MWEQDAAGRVRTPLEPVVLGAAIALIPVMIVETTTNGWVQTAALAANWAIWGIFVAELLLVLIVAERKWAALNAHWLDVAIVVLTPPIYGQVLSSLRYLRLLRLLTFVQAGLVVARAVRAERTLSSGQTLRFAALAAVFLVLIAGAAQATFNGDEFGGFWDGVWWAWVTVTTVGYGDIVVADVEGRVIGMILMLVGIGFIGVLTATVASRFMQKESHVDQIMEKLDRIETELAEMKGRRQQDET